MISVIIPVYNVEMYLKECLDSVLNQTFEDLEIICVNDGSTDSSPDILNDYAKNDSRIKIINQENQGLGAARNTGLNNAYGEYVLFIDSDDFLFNDSIEKMYVNAKSNNSELIIFRFNLFNDDNFSRGGFNLENIFKNKDYLNFTFNYKSLGKFIMNANFSAWSKMYKHEFLIKNDFKFPIGIAYEDVLFHIQTAIKAESISFIPDFLYNYRISNNESIMHDMSNIWDIFEVCDSVESFLKNDGYFEELKAKFLIFKITQLVQYVLFSNSEEFFSVVFKTFKSFFENEDYDFIRIFEKLPEKIKMIFNLLLNSRGAYEFSKKVNVDEIYI